MSDDLVARLDAYHARHPSWGSLHVMMADGNLDDDCAAECLAQAMGDYDIVAEALRAQGFEIDEVFRVESDPQTEADGDGH